MGQSFLTIEHKLVQESSNRFYQSVISDSVNVTVAKSIKVGNFYHLVGYY